MTHRDLVKVAARWLRLNCRCNIVATEVVTSAGETPDAIGWSQGGNLSVMVEVKMTRPDFMRDAAKGDDRAGLYKFYLTPPGLIPRVSLPAGWGLLESDGGGVVVIKHAAGTREGSGSQVQFISGGRRNRRREISILYSLLLRNCGKSPALKQATLTVEDESDASPQVSQVPQPGHGEPDSGGAD
jgi:hypothetical protein